MALWPFMVIQGHVFCGQWKANERLHNYHIIILAASLKDFEDIDGNPNHKKSPFSITPLLLTLLHESHVQKGFTISEVEADWHELMILQRIMLSYIARVTNN